MRIDPRDSSFSLLCRFNCILLRETPFECTLRLWDTYLSEGDNFRDFLVYVCAAFLLKWRERSGVVFALSYFRRTCVRKQ